MYFCSTGFKFSSISSKCLYSHSFVPKVLLMPFEYQWHNEHLLCTYLHLWWDRMYMLVRVWIWVCGRIYLNLKLCLNLQPKCYYNNYYHNNIWIERRRFKNKYLGIDYNFTPHIDHHHHCEYPHYHHHRYHHYHYHHHHYHHHHYHYSHLFVVQTELGTKRSMMNDATST